MGNSSTARYSDGQAIHGAEAAWPAGLRERWPKVVESLLRELGGPAPSVSTARIPAVDLKQVLQDTTARAAIERLARRHHVDEADVARLWSRDARTTGLRVQAVTAMERRVHEAAGRLGATTKATIRAQLVSAVAAAAAPDRPVKDWWSTDTGRSVAGRALALAGRKERRWPST